MDFEAREDADGVRLSWNCIPKLKLQHLRNVIPMGALYTPLNTKSLNPIALLPKDQLALCRQCKCAINPYARVANDSWLCQFCGFINRLPQINGQIVVPPAVDPSCTTVEYQTGRASALPPIFLFVVDTCFAGEDLADLYRSLQQSLIQSLDLLPDDSLVGFISFGAHVQVHDMSAEKPRLYTFNGEKNYTLETVQKILGFLDPSLKLVSMQNGETRSALSHVSRRFFQSIGDVQYRLTEIIESLLPNCFPYKKYLERPIRATGTAVSVASLLLTAALGSQVQTTGGHILCFVNGECTSGPGKIVGRELREPLRSHHDIVRASHTQIPRASSLVDKTTKADSSLAKASKKFFHTITERLVASGLLCSFFIGSYDQVGLFEMDETCSKTGGVVVMCDLFNTAIFKQSLARFFKQSEVLEYDVNGSEYTASYLDMGFNATLECRATSDLKVQGLIGNASALPLLEEKTTTHAASSYVSPTVIGEGGTNSWKLCTIDPQSTFAIYFDKQDSANTPHSYVQFLTHYQHPSGEMRLRITTVQIVVITELDPVTLEYGFDQEAALVLVARQAISQLAANHGKGSSNGKSELGITKILDQTLVSFCARFAEFIAGSLDSFRLLATYAMLPQFMFHLRRSPFIQVFNNSPDESSFLRHVLMHEDVASSLLMIQPTLVSYDINTFGTEDPETGMIIADPEPVLLDSMSLGASKILLLDTFFHVLIFHGAQVRDWKRAGYQDQEEYAHFRDFLDAPKQEAREILLDRFPLPRYIDCDAGGSQARFLMAKLNPSTTYASNTISAAYTADHGEGVYTDDISLQAFMEQVKSKVVMAKKPKA